MADTKGNTTDTKMIVSRHLERTVSPNAAVAATYITDKVEQEVNRKADTIN